MTSNDKFLSYNKFIMQMDWNYNAFWPFDELSIDKIECHVKYNFNDYY